MREQLLVLSEVELLLFGFAFACLLCVAFIACQRRTLSLAHVLMDNAVDETPYGFVLFDDKGRLQKANKKSRQFLPFLASDIDGGLKLNQFLDHMYDNAMDCDESLRNVIYASLEGDSVEGFREVVEWGQNKICLVEEQAASGKCVVFVLRDISYLKEHEEKFLLTNQHNYALNQAVEAATIGIIISDPKQDGNPIVFVNDAFCEFVGLPKDEIIGNGWSFVLDALDHYDAAQSLFQALDDGGRADLEVVVSKDDVNKTRWFSVKLTPVEDVAGGLDLFIGGITETTALKKQEQELFKAQKLDALGQMAAGVAHDFNNVLSIIDGYTRLTMKEVEDDTKAYGYLERVDVAAKRGASLTRRMLTFAHHRIVTDNVVDLSQLITDQELLLRPLLDASIDFSINASLENVFVECVPDSMGQILMNLVINARDAMSEGGSITVNVVMASKKDLHGAVPEDKRDVEYICLSVEDTGTGMDEKVKARIFDPFFTTKDQGKGTGLGLSMVYGMVQEMGAFLHVVSSPGCGTKMQVYIPVTDKEPSKVVSGSDDDIDGLSLHGYTVLVAEDEPDLLSLLSEMLVRLGMNVIQASNGNEALLKQEDHIGDIDLLITDIVMPELNGVKLAELFHSLREDTEIIFMSGYPAHGEKSRVEIPNDAIFVAKPVEYEVLARLVYQVLVTRGEQDNLAEESGSRWETNFVNSGV